MLEIKTEIKIMVDSDDLLKEKITNVCTIKGIRFMTAITIIAETNGFALATNQRQLVSYDIVQNQSGTTLNGKTRISKKGNNRIRKALYFSSISVSQFDTKHKRVYSQIYEKTTIKMKGIVAVHRRLLVLIYTIFTNNVPYDPNYKQNQKIRQNQNDTIGMVEICPA